MKYEFYKEPFDVNKPPPSPPNRDMTNWPFLGFCETAKSKKQTREYIQRLNEHSFIVSGHDI